MASPAPQPALPKATIRCPVDRSQLVLHPPVVFVRPVASLENAIGSLIWRKNTTNGTRDDSRPANPTSKDQRNISIHER